ncbi:hypothetical protein NA56DRAFT_712380 [Hyaloscypha hepaticicola]|uniref:Major facilitator superfamily (MFS) profile domain-containing protein n=1 Tax=Hyaloscypha hepaticicola TaxID=2082293 RepID=A0A2J6PGV5_9HELO|nr:hypothetical protein NA56DRAFT_712380 [Hyaloscypha hepaticicola]
MSLEPSSDAVMPVTDVDDSSYPHNTGSKENSQGVIDGSTTTEAFSDTQFDVALLLNWPIRKKLLNMAVPSFICFAVAFGSSIYAPAIPDIMRDFTVSEVVATLPLTTYVLGLSFGPMLSAPISEMMGRLGTYRISVPIGALFTLGEGFAPNIAACVS